MHRQLYPDPTPDSSEQTHFCPVTDGADFTAQIIHFLDRPIAFHRCFARITGSITAVLLLSQALNSGENSGSWQRQVDDNRPAVSIG